MPVDYSKWNNLEVSDDEEEDTEPRLEVIGSSTAYKLPKKHPLNNEKLDAGSRELVLNNIRDVLKEVVDTERMLEDETLESKAKMELERQLFNAKNRYVELLNETEIEEPKTYPDVCRLKQDSSLINKHPASSAEAVPLTKEELLIQQRTFDENRKLFLTLCEINDPKKTALFFRKYPTLFSSRTTDILLNLAMAHGKNKDFDKMDNTLKQCMLITYAVKTASMLRITSDMLPHFLVGYLDKLDKSWNAASEETLAVLREVLLRGKNDG